MSDLLDAVLRAFPAHTHPLTLVSDADGALADPMMRAALAERGFRLIEQADPIALRAEVARARPFTAATPVIVITAAPVNTLPYDLWQQGHRVTLTLRELFPSLDLSVVRLLSSRQRRRLSETLSEQKPGQMPGQIPGAAALTRRETIALVMAQVFRFPLDAPVSPAQLLVWLADDHASAGPLPPELAAELLARLRQEPRLTGWPLDALLTDAMAYRRFAQDGWQAYLRQHAAVPADQRMADATAPYTPPAARAALPFDTDVALQDALPRLVRSGVIQPVAVSDESALPSWAHIAVAGHSMEERLRAYEMELRLLMPRIERATQWGDWREIALAWARLSLIHDDLRLQFSPTQRAQIDRTRSALDAHFHAWLAGAYAPLAIQALPTPHHLFHVPGWLAAQRSRRPNVRTAMLIFDGMSIADWLLIRETWQQRHPDWAFDQLLALAEAPSITALSRLALVSGIRPNALTYDQLGNQREERLWRDFWQQKGLPADAAAYTRLPARAGASYPSEIGSFRTQAICLVNTIVDDMVHGATQGAASVRAALEVWLRQRDAAQPGSAWMEGMVQHLLDGGYRVTITSDHGHVEAVGIGAPSEGVVVSTRSKRARLYSSPDLARQAQERLPATMLLGETWLAPSGVYPLVPTGRQAFATAGERVVSHGGLSIEELLVPLITLTKK